MEVCPVEEATVHWKIIRPVKVNVSTNINTLTKRLMVLRPGIHCGYRTQWVHKQIMHRDNDKNEHKKTIPSTKAGLHLQACSGSWRSVLICAAETLSDFTGECGPGDRLQKRPGPFHSREKNLNSQCEHCAYIYGQT